MSEAFERRFSAANIKGLDAQTWDLFVRTLNARLRGVEEKKASFEAAEQVLVSLGLSRINEALLPAFQTITGLAHLGALLTATSTTTLTVSVGAKQLTIAEAHRDRFAPAAYLALRKSGDNSVVMTGSLVSYHRETGTLTVDVDNVRGNGDHDAWIISASPAPDFSIDSDAILQQAFAAVDAAVAQLVGSAPETLDTIHELAQALGSDPNFSVTVLNALALRLRVDTAQGLSGPQQSQARANLGLGNVLDVAQIPADDIAAVVFCASQAAYDAINPKIATTLYLIAE